MRFRYVAFLLCVLAMTTPWYWRGDAIDPVVLGLPAWAFVSLLVSLLLSAATAWVILRKWPEDDNAQDS